jgi:hypothetical protein
MGAEPLFRFGLLADVQYRDRDDNPQNNRWYRSALDRLSNAVDYFNARGDLDFTIQVGDLIDGDLDSYDAVLNYADGTDFDPNRRAFSELTMPIYHVMGNHEVYPTSGDQQTLVRARLGFQNNVAYYDFAPGPGYRFLVLDDQVPENVGHPVGLTPEQDAYFSEQLTWAHATIQNAWLAGERVVLVEHYPNGVLKWSNNKPLDNAWEEAIVDLFETYPNVSALLAGHYHSGGYGVVDGAQFVAFKAMLSVDPAGVPPDPTNVYYILDAHPDRLVIDGFGGNAFGPALDRDLTLRAFPDVPPGDFNFDLSVDAADAAIWAANFGKNGNWQQGDVDRDGRITGSDWLRIQAQWGTGAGPALVAVPEPSSLVVVFVMVVVLQAVTQRFTGASQHALNRM